MPDGGYALSGLQGLSQAQTSQARAGAAPPGKISGTVPVISPGGGCRLARPTGASHRLIPVGPRKRSARRARYQTRYLYRRVAATPCPAYRGLSQAHTSQARASAAPPGKISGTVPVISPGGGCRLTRPTGSSHRLIPRRPAQAQRRRARYQARFL